jgi:AcrR family transcriptional regulator
MPGQRADARRNYERILAVAEQEVARHGADASLEQIARVAQVGSATVRRHFPTRIALLEAVFRERVEVMCARARELAEGPDARAALLEWLSVLVTFSAGARGLVELLQGEGTEGVSEERYCCSAELTGVTEPLVAGAARAGALTPGATADDVLTLVTGIVLATVGRRDQAAEAHRLLALAVAGISP